MARCDAARRPSWRKALQPVRWPESRHGKRRPTPACRSRRSTVRVAVAAPSRRGRPTAFRARPLYCQINHGLPCRRRPCRRLGRSARRRPVQRPAGAECGGSVTDVAPQRHSILFKVAYHPPQPLKIFAAKPRISQGSFIRQCDLTHVVAGHQPALMRPGHTLEWMEFENRNSGNRREHGQGGCTIIAASRNDLRVVTRGLVRSAGGNSDVPTVTDFSARVATESKAADSDRPDL